jgi:NADH-quinone oxidoreductase subunit K
MISIFDCLFFSIFLFFIGIIGVVINRKNIIILLICIELLLLAVNTSFITFAYFKGDILGQVFVLFVLAISAVEASIGLAIIVTLFRKNGVIDISTLNELKE